jgi:hypothetical protein
LAKETKNPKVKLENIVQKEEEEVLVYATKTNIFAVLNEIRHPLLRQSVPSHINSLCYFDMMLFFGTHAAMYSMHEDDGQPQMYIQHVDHLTAKEDEILYKSLGGILSQEVPEQKEILSDINGIYAIHAFDDNVAYATKDPETNNYVIRVAEVVDGNAIMDTEIVQTDLAVDSLCFHKDGFYFASSSRNYVCKSPDGADFKGLGGIKALAAANDELYAVSGEDLYNVTKQERVGCAHDNVVAMCAVPKKFIIDNWIRK